jgi:hypothetical protein
MTTAIRTHDLTKDYGAAAAVSRWPTFCAPTQYLTRRTGQDREALPVHTTGNSMMRVLKI